MKEKGEKFSNAVKKIVWQEQRNACAICGVICKGQHAERRGQVHHIKPRSQGGSGRRENALGLCSPCHKVEDDKVLRRTSSDISLHVPQLQSR